MTRFILVLFIALPPLAMYLLSLSAETQGQKSIFVRGFLSGFLFLLFMAAVFFFCLGKA